MPAAKVTHLKPRLLLEPLSRKAAPAQYMGLGSVSLETSQLGHQIKVMCSLSVGRVTSILA